MSNELIERIEEIHINVHGRVVIRHAGGRCEDVTDNHGKVIYRPETSAITTLPNLEEWIGENAFAMQVDGEIVGRGIHEEDFRAFLAGKVLVPVEAIEIIKENIAEIRNMHRDKNDHYYNECELSECMWCETSAKAIAMLTATKGE